MNASPPLPTPQRVYLAGPMAGIPHFNFPRFNAIAAGLRANGHTVFNPAEKDIERHDGVDLSADNPAGSVKEAQEKHGFSLRAALAEDCKFICEQATVIVMLPGWEQSLGAQAEHRLAVALKREGMEIIYLTDTLCAVMEGIHAQAR